jgi:WD40 repeat protein
MSTMNKHAFLLIFFALCLETGATQCFTTNFLKGVNFYNEQLYWHAQTQFRAALKCSDATGVQKEQGLSWLDRSTQAYVQSIEEAKNKMERMLQLAEDRLDLIGAGYLSLLASWELEKGHPDDALALAYSACQIFPGNPIPPAKSVLGNAICNKYAIAWDAHSKAVINGAFIPESNLLFTLSSDQTVKIWDRKGAPVNTLSGHKDDILDVRASPSGQYLLTTSKDKSGIIWSTYGSRLHFLQHEEEVVAGSFISDDKTAVTCTKEGVIRIWDAETGKLEKSLTTMNKPVNGILTLHDKDLFLTSAPTAAELWNASGQAIGQLSHEDAVINAVDFSPSEQLILTAADDGTVKTWDIQGNLLRVFQKHKGAVRHAAFSHDGSKIVSCGDDMLTIVMDVNDQWTYELKGLDSPVRFAAFAPGDYFVLTETDDGALTLWKGQRIMTQMNLQTASAIKPVFAPDGQSFIVIASGVADTLQLRDMQGDLLMSAPVFKGSVTSACFSPNGNHILASSEDGSARIFPTPAFYRRQVSSGAEPFPTLNEAKRKELFFHVVNELVENELATETVGFEPEPDDLPAWNAEVSESAASPEISDINPIPEAETPSFEAVSPDGGGGPSEKITVNALSKSEKVRERQIPPKQTTEKASSYPSYMIITETSLREGPHHTRKSLKRLPLGAHLKLLDGISDPLWARISWDGTEGWVKKSAIKAL